MLLYLKWQVRDDAGESKAHQEEVGEDEGPGGIGDLLNLFVGATGLTGLPDGTKQNKIESGFFSSLFFFFSFLNCVFSCMHSHLFTFLSLSSSQSLSLQSMT